jgi:hypothetical protein
VVPGDELAGREGRRIAGLPIFMPADPGIPAEEVRVQPTMTREFVLDKENLQREQKEGVAGWLTLAAYLFVGSLSFFLIALIGWGLVRLERFAAGPPGEGAAPPGVGPAKEETEEGGREVGGGERKAPPGGAEPARV